MAASHNAGGAPPKIGLALIARDEQETLGALLESATGAFDYVALVDTGSKDETVAVFNAWAQAERERQPGFDAAWVPMAWSDDFAVARQRADELLASFEDCAWLAWSDCDDVIHGADRLRQLAADAPPELSAYVAGYDYAQDPASGGCVCYLRRERLVRRGHGRWEGRVHEAQIVEGPVMQLPPELVEWVHHKPLSTIVPLRNLRILRRWLKDEPANARVLAYLGTEEAALGKPKRAVSYFRRYLKLETAWPDERAQIHRRYGVCLLMLGRPEEAIKLALDALQVQPEWPDSALTLAEANLQAGRPEHAAYWAKRVLDVGVPETLLIINPTDYTLQARVVLALALGAQGRLEEAIEVAEDAAKIGPAPALEGAYEGWRSIRKRERVAADITRQAELLVAHDEQEKALALLERAVPYFVIDHPQVVAARSHLRERLAFATDPDAYAAHYAGGATKPEDMTRDEDADRIAESLPRAHFLLEGLRELAA